MYEISIKIKIL